MESRVNDAPGENEETGDEEIENDRPRLIFTCCHPALPEGQVALTGPHFIFAVIQDL
jgi:RNA polymerase sigma-70 factor (ECF subfamily)